jgi:hypothetical protein
MLDKFDQPPSLSHQSSSSSPEPILDIRQSQPTIIPESKHENQLSEMEQSNSHNSKFLDVPEA